MGGVFSTMIPEFRNPPTVTCVTWRVKSALASGIPTDTGNKKSDDGMPGVMPVQPAG